MKRATILFVLAAAIMLAIPAAAHAAGWATTVSPALASPHSAYSQTTRKCAVCHAVHEAENTTNGLNGEVLLRSTVAGACDYCHVGGPFAATQVYGSNTAYYGADVGREHSIGGAFTTIPDSNDATGQANPANDYTISGGLNCTSCHSVHSANTILAGTDILKANPNQSHAGTATTATGFCADCHSNNWMTIKDLPGTDTASHYMGAVTSATLASAASTNCRDCHDGAAVGTANNNYPHYTTGKYFLKDAYTGAETATSTKLDGVCLDCHPNVGTMF